MSVFSYFIIYVGVCSWIKMNNMMNDQKRMCMFLWLVPSASDYQLSCSITDAVPGRLIVPRGLPAGNPTPETNALINRDRVLSVICHGRRRRRIKANIQFRFGRAARRGATIRPAARRLRACESSLDSWNTKIPEHPQVREWLTHDGTGLGHSPPGYHYSALSKRRKAW